MLQQNGITITELTNIGSNIAANSVLPIVNLVTDETQKTSVALLGNYILNNVAPNTTVNLGDIANITITGGSNGYVLHTHGNGELYWGIDDDAFPGGPNTAVQFNNNNEFGGSTNFTYNSATNVLTVTGNVAAGNVLTDHLLYANGQPWDLQLPGGPNKAVQFNNNDSFDGSSSFTYDNDSNTLTVTNIVAGNITGNLGNLIANHITANTIDVNDITIGNLHIPSVGNGTQQQVLGIVNQDTQQLGWKTVPVYYITVGLRDGTTYLSSPNALLRVYPVGQRNGTYMDTNTTQI